MQCQSYFPVYHSHYDLNVDANGGATPLYTGNGTFQSGHYKDYVSSSPIPREPFLYKEVLRQTMLMHEVTFKDQVQELHRLYRRQKELMGEIKSQEVYMNQVQIEVQSSNSTLARISTGCGQNTQHSLPFINSQSAPSSTGRDNIQTSFSSEKEQKEPSSPVASQHGGTLNYLQYTECKVRKIKGKLLDLELPAETYIDSDEEEFLQDAEFSKAFTPASLSSNKRSKIVVKTDVTGSFSGTNNNLADLNEPLETSCLEEGSGDKKEISCLESSERTHDQSHCENITSDGAADKSSMKPLDQSDLAKSEVAYSSFGRKPSYKIGQNPPVVQALPSFNNQLSSSKGAKTCGRQKGLLNNKVNGSLRCSPNSSAAKSLKSSCSEPKLKESVNCIDLNSAVVGISEFMPSGDTWRKSKKCRMIDINLPCDITTDDEPLVQDDLLGHDHEKSGRRNLNFCVNDNILPPKSTLLDNTRLDIDIKAPISPEVEERPPPRGDSEENQPEDCGDVLVELSKIAAEAIVSISSYKSRSYSKIVALQECEASDNGNLEWFAGLIDSLSTDLEKDRDDFEAKTLELPEMKLEDYCCRNNVQISNEPCSMLMPCQTRRGRTRRSKRKDFKKEVLPSLASLSKYEVTEDIQMIEGLMEAAGTPWQLSRTRRACRMGRKPRAAKQQIFVDDVHVPELRAHISWGEVSRRPRGRRSPASRTVSSKWFEYAI